MKILYINILFEGMNRILWTVRRGLDVDAQLIKGTLVFFVSTLSISYTCLTFWVLEPPQLLKVGERRPVYLKGNTLTITIIPRNLVSNRFKCALLDWKTPHRLHTERPKPGGRLAQSSSANQEDGDLCWSCWRHPCSSIALVSAAASQQLQLWMSLCQCLLLRPNILFTLLRRTSSSCVWVWLLGWWQSWLGTPL